MNNTSRHPGKFSRENWLHIAVIILLITIIYIPSLDAPFIFDDFVNIVFNTKVHATNISELSKAFDSDISATRPLALLTFSLNHLLTGLDVYWFHVFNIMIHIFNTFLLYKLLVIFPRKQSLSSSGEIQNLNIARYAFWAATLWAVNPVQTQGITYIVQRMASLATLFYLAGIYIFILWRRGSCKTRYFLLLLSFFFLAGMACKETVLTLPIALLLIEFIFYPEKFKISRPVFIGSVALSIILGFYYLDGIVPDWTSTYPQRNFSPWERVMTQCRVIWHYLYVYIFPLPSRLLLTYDYPVSRGLLTPWTTIAGFIAIMATITAAIACRKKWPIISWSILFYFLAIAPESSFVNLELAFIHRLYLPSLFIPLVIVEFISKVSDRRIEFTLIFFLVALLSYGTILRNDEWSIHDRFWESNISRGTVTARSKNNLAVSLLEAGDYDKAIAVLQEGRNISDRKIDRERILYNLGVALYHQKEHIKSLQVLVELSNEFGAVRDSYLFIGRIYLATKQYDKARVIIKKLSEYREIEYQSKILQAELSIINKQYPEAEKIISEAIENEAGKEVFIRHNLLLTLAKIYVKQGKTDQTYKILLTIIDEYPYNYAVWRMIYAMLESGGDKKNSEIIRKFLESRNAFTKKIPPDLKSQRD